MSKLDHIYEEVVKDILANGVSDEGTDVRGKYADGTPAYTKSKFGVQLEYDTSEVPTLTTKRVPHITAGKEMILFWVKQTVKEEDFIEANCHVWQEWFNEQRNLGRSYAYQFESHRNHIRDVIKIKPIIKEHHGELKQIICGDREEPNWSNKDHYIGKIVDTSNSGKFIVLDVFEEEESTFAKIQFFNTNSIRIIDRSRLTGGSVKEMKDLFKRNLLGVGYLGNYKSVRNYTDEEISILLKRWQAMIRRCYDQNHKSSSVYKDKGIFVNERWHSFENFLRDIRYIPQFFLAKEKKFKGYDLDKDYYGSNCYSKETCAWLESRENRFYTSSCKPFRIINEDEGVDEVLLTTTEANRKYGLDTGDCSRYLNGKPRTKRIKGFHLEYVDDEENLYRYELSRNQVVELLREIKENPSSRRLLTSFWNFADVKKKVLQECAFQTQWKVSQGYLELILTQRSCDIGLGYVFNVYQYYLLLRLIAHVSGLKVGAFKHQLGDYHIYDRHEDVIIEQIEREKHPAPVLDINPNVTDFFDFTISDIRVVDYQSSGESPMEVAI